MKVWRLTLFLIYATFLIRNAEFVYQDGERPKLNKTFDEIYGKGWDAEVPEFTEISKQF